ncbi:MAG: sulfurtransferase [Dehalococcoidia bacterium]|nr:sulfurtransferase [Dehalococcoidia bacterium]
MTLKKITHWSIMGFALLISLALFAGCASKATSTSVKPTSTVATAPKTTSTPTPSPTATQTTAATTKTSSAPTPTPTTAPATTQVAGYANPDLLVETLWLSQHLNDAGIRVVDVRTAAQYKAGHIQGAVSLPVEETFDQANLAGGDLGTTAQLEKAFGDRGIASDTRVIIYDGGKETKAGRLFWTLEYAGHTKAAYLNGGLTKWQKENLPVSTDETKATAAKFTANIKPATLATKADVLAAIGKPGNAIVDTRSPAEYKGDDLRAKRGGHIPGAVNVDWTTQYISGDVPVLKSAAELKKMYEDLGVTRDKTIYVHCQSGQRSAVTYLVLRIMGYQNVRNYDGSWLEWGNDDTTPIEK